MKPSQEYLNMISKRLEALNPGGFGTTNSQGCNEPLKMPSLIDQMGQTAIEYLKKKKTETYLPPDPLFPDRNF